MNLQLQAGYFSIKNPFEIFDRWMNPYHHKDSIDIRGKKMAVMYSKRAEKALWLRTTPLIAELQLYFTCVVQKRVVFHEQTELDTINASPNLKVAYHTVLSNACGPIEFADKHPVKKELNSKGAQFMRPSMFQIDYKDNKWIGEFFI